MAKLHEVLAVVQGKLARATRDFTTLHRLTQVPDVVVGRSRTYQPRGDGDDVENLPDQSQQVRLIIDDALREAVGMLAPAYDVIAARDAGNMLARANVLVDGEPLFDEPLPAVTLLALEKRLTDWITFLSKLPTLDPAYEWTPDPGRGIHVSRAVVTASKKERPRPVELAPATKEHPAQVKLVPEETIVGDWTTIMHSGALPPKRKAALLAQATKVLDAVKVARTTANQVEVPVVHIGERLFSHLLAA